MGFSVFLLYLRVILLCFLAYCGLGYGCIRLYETKTFYVPFSKELVAGGVYNNSTHSKLMKSHAAPFIGLLVVSLVLVAVLCILTPLGLLMAIACFVAGIIVYFQALRSKKAMIRLFVHQYRRHMDEGRLDALLRHRYGMTANEPISAR